VAYARLVHAGRNPYRSGPADLGDRDPRAALVAPRWLHTPMVYGPLTAWATAAIAPVESLLGALWAFKLEMLLASLAAVPHNRWRLPFGNLVLLVARRKCESIGEMPRNAVSA